MTICPRRKLRKGWRVPAFSLALALMLAGSAQAGFLAGDSDAMAGYHGTLSLSDTLGKHTLNVLVDYAVYAPGTFDNSFSNEDPSDGTGYVYAYQFVNSATSTSKEVIEQFAVGLNVHAQVANQEQLSDPNAPAGQLSEPPGFGGSVISSALWSYSGLRGSADGVLPGEKSEILIFTSPFAPGWGSTSMQASYMISVQTPASGVAAVFGNAVPSPTPEPATVVLMATAAGLFVLLRVVRRELRC